MTEGWAFTGGPPTTPSMSTVSLVEGRCFCVSEPSGDIGAAGGHGLVVKDTRFLDAPPSCASTANRSSR